MNGITLANVLSVLQSFSPILLPVLAALVGFGIHHLPSRRLAQLQQIAATVVPAVEQQANGGWTNEEKYNAAAQALNLLAAKFGYRVNAAEVKLLVEGAVAAFKSLKSSTSDATSAAPATAPSGAGSSSQATLTPSDASVAGAV